MAGGVMNIAFTGQQNEFLTGNPSKSLFKGKYAQYTNFGLQKFRVDFDGTKMLRMTEPSVFTFKITFLTFKSKFFHYTLIIYFYYLILIYNVFFFPKLVL